MSTEFRARRINVVGTSSVGKTTVAAALASQLGVPHEELDALHWEPNWTAAPDDVLRERVRHALSGDGWVVDGNYAKLRATRCCGGSSPPTGGAGASTHRSSPRGPTWWRSTCDQHGRRTDGWST
jgi:hypothetical protein